MLSELAIVAKFIVVNEKEIETMPLYEVTYEEAGEMKSEVVEAPGPVEAGNLFRQENIHRQISVVCVVRQ